jgi:hypothetical protein
MKSFISAILVVLTVQVIAQERMFTRTATVMFSSETPLEKIEATNTKGTCVVDLNTGRVQFSLLIKGFAFKKALMEEHFNENYMESSKYPKAQFKGEFVEMDKSIMTNGKELELQVKGELTVHGVTKERTLMLQTIGTGDGAEAKCTFVIAPEDHGIEVPSVVRDNIAKEINVSIEADLLKM